MNALNLVLISDFIKSCAEEFGWKQIPEELRYYGTTYAKTVTTHSGPSTEAVKTTRIMWVLDGAHFHYTKSYEECTANQDNLALFWNTYSEPEQQIDLHAPNSLESLRNLFF